MLGRNLVREIQGKNSTKFLDLIPGSHEITPILFLAILVSIMYGSALRNFWLGDDSQILKHAILYHPWEYFFIPGVWREFSANNLTPWVVFSFDIDWSIFGVHPYGFYFHQLVSLCLLVVIAYAVFRLWYSVPLSLFGVVLFAISPPFAESSQLLMVRHYIEGAIFAILCVYFFVMALRKNNFRFNILSAFFYLLSCSAKEIYVPLIFLLLLLPEKSLRDRLIICLPCLGVTLLYATWRWFMLGNLWGGYGLESIGMHDWKIFFLRLLDVMGAGLSERLIIGWRWLIGGSSLLALTIWFITNKKNLLYFLVISTLILLPIVPVASIMSSRYVWLPSLFWAVLHINTWEGLKKNSNRFLVRIVVILWGIILLISFLCSSLSALGKLRTINDRQSEEGIFVLHKGIQTDLLVNPVSSGWYYSGLSWLRNEILQLPSGPSVSADPQVLCLEDSSDQLFKTVWHFDLQRNRLLSESYQRYRERVCTEEAIYKLRLDEPLFIELHYNDLTVDWVFGPYEEGTYALLAGEMAEGVFPLPSKGHRIVRFNDSAIPVRLRYSSPEGWVTYSSLLRLEVQNGRGRLQWQR